MTTHEVTHQYLPFWLHTLPDKDREDVQEWLTKAGMDLTRCPGFDYDGQLITTRYYKYVDGQAVTWKDGVPMYEDAPAMFFAPKPHPKVIDERMKSA